MKLPVLSAALLLAVPALGAAEGWTGTGELGLAVARGNSESENLNTKLEFVNEGRGWTHTFGFAAVRARAEVDGDFDGDGVEESRLELSANRFQLTASSAYHVSERASWVGALRHEDDDFSTYERQSTLSLGYGYKFIDEEALGLSTELGPGYRLATRRSDGEDENEAIFRGLLAYRHALTPTTTLENKLLVEAGGDNTFAQNDFGVSVAMNSRLALKAGLQLRYNSDTEPGIESTDSLTTVNLVYSFK